MELVFEYKKIIASNADKIVGNGKVSIYKEFLHGIKSNNIVIHIEERTQEIDEDSGYISFELNRNEARYLMNTLSAFLNEEEI